MTEHRDAFIPAWLKWTAVFYSAWTLVKFLLFPFISPNGRISLPGDLDRALHHAGVFLLQIDPYLLTGLTLVIGGSCCFLLIRESRAVVKLDPDFAAWAGRFIPWLLALAAFTPPLARLATLFPSNVFQVFLWVGVLPVSLLAILMGRALTRVVNRKASAAGLEKLCISWSVFLLWAFTVLWGFYPFPSLTLAETFFPGATSLDLVILGLWWASAPALIFATLAFLSALQKALNGLKMLPEQPEA